MRLIPRHCVLLAVCIPTVARSTDISFRIAPTYPTVATPWAIASADFDGDGPTDGSQEAVPESSLTKGTRVERLTLVK